MAFSKPFLILFSLLVLFITGCASHRFEEPMEVNLVGVEPMQGEGLEVRMLVKLRVQNPNNASLAYNGISIQLDLQGKRFASGVSDVEGRIPRFGETIIEVPMSISAFGMARQALGVANSQNYSGKFPYEINGQLAGPGFDVVKFQNEGELTLPAELRYP